jgi:hypothetical protein
MDGCECATAGTTTGCCATGCETIHDNGVGQPFYDCNPLGTWGESTAQEACTAYAVTVGGDFSFCETAAACGSGVGVCLSFLHTYCWWYFGPQAGWVTNELSCVTKISAWQ